jgi:hypothetical protein
MYSHGSSARAGIGKSGHGGRNYRPPKERRDPNVTPPPLKQCACLLEFQLEEYAQPAPDGRPHHALGGRQALQNLEGTLRSDFSVHLIVPGRRQSGPVAIVGRAYRDALPAAAHLLNQISRNLISQQHQAATVEGRIFLNVQDPKPKLIEGRWTSSSSCLTTIHWLFQSADWSVLACPLVGEVDDSMTTTATTAVAASNSEVLPPHDNGTGIVTTLQTCLDNAAFRLGSSSISNLDIFVDGTTAFCAGNHGQAMVLFQEVSKALDRDG